jgi:hypothetical protein
MADDDLIRRGDVAAAVEVALKGLAPFSVLDAIAALPAQGVKPLVWADYEEIVRDAQSGMHYASRALNGFNAYFVMQDGEQFRWWTSGHQTDHSAAHPTLDAAKAAAQRDYERRILAALAPASGGVEARPNAPCHIVEYTNWRGETARRAIIPIRMWWGKTEWHPQEQWMLTAWDVEKEATRDFAWQDMKPVQNGATSAAVAAHRDTPAPVDALVKAAAQDAREVFEDYGSKAREAIDYMEQVALAAIREGGDD